MELTTENILMIGSAMLIFSIIIVKAGFRRCSYFSQPECSWA